MEQEEKEANLEKMGLDKKRAEFMTRKEIREMAKDMREAAKAKKYAEINAENEAFKKLYDSMMAFRAETYLWQQVSEYTFDTFMMIKQREGALQMGG